MSVPNNGNYCMQCDANSDDDYNDAYKYVNDMNQLRDTVIGYGKMKCFVCSFLHICLTRLVREMALVSRSFSSFIVAESSFT